jgi:transposase
MSGKRYSEEYQTKPCEVAKQGDFLSSVAEGLGISYESLSDWVKRYDNKPARVNVPVQHFIVE